MACCTKATKGASSPARQESTEAVRLELTKERQLNNKLACKVDMLTAMLAMKDEMLRTSEERFAALKWEVVHNFHGDERKLATVTERLREAVHGWRGDEASTATVAPLVVWRRRLIASRLGETPVPTADFGRILADCLPEFRCDYIAGIVENAGRGPTIDPTAFVKHCEDVFVESLRTMAHDQDRIGRAAQAHVVVPEAPPPPLDVVEAPIPHSAPPPDIVQAAPPAPPSKRPWWRKPRSKKLQHHRA